MDITRGITNAGAILKDIVNTSPLYSSSILAMLTTKESEKEDDEAILHSQKVEVVKWQIVRDGLLTALGEAALPRVRRQALTEPKKARRRAASEMMAAFIQG